MEVRIGYDQGVRFTAEARGHRVVCDQPASNGGEDLGMTPPEFLLAALGTCAGYYAAQYLKNHNLPAAGLEVKVVAEKAAQPARLGSFQIDVIAPGAGPEHDAGLHRAVKACLIHNTLLHAPAISIAVNAPVPVSD